MIFKYVNIDGLNIFYREAGKETAPKLVLLHGFPSSSHQYRNLIPALADRFHIIAPDYPGFGNSDMPDLIWKMLKHKTLARKDANVLGEWASVVPQVFLPFE
jgi:pimeloyl-ACP methyl ester carboxylesterase